METDQFSEEEPHLTPGSVGPIVLLLPLAVSLLAFSIFRDIPSAIVGPRAVPPQHSAEEHVEVWQGELVLADGLRWRATLRPMHSDEVRQAFDSRVLKQRFDLPTGQVFRFELSEVSNAASLEPRELPLAGGNLTVTDSEGLALSLLTGGSRDTAIDPLRTLFEAPSQSVGPGGTASWVLWGRAPGSKPTVQGLSVGRDLVLEPRSIPREQVDVALVRRTQ